MMGTVTEKRTMFSEAFEKSLAVREEPDWFRTFREEAFFAFKMLGFPTTRDEEWKYTNLSGLAGGSFLVPDRSRAVAGNGAEETAAEEVISRGLSNPSARIVFVGGVYSRALSFTREGIEARPFTSCFDDPAFRKRIGAIAETNGNAMRALNAAFAGDGVFIQIPENIKPDRIIEVVFVGGGQGAFFPRVLFSGARGSEAEMVERFIRYEDSSYFTNAVIEIELDDNASLKHSRIQRESHDAFHILSSQVELGRSSVYDLTTIMLGSGLSRHDIGLGFNGEGAEAWVDGLYLVEDSQHTDTHSRIDHRVPNCRSHQSYKGILDGRSRAVFNGKVFVHENARGTDAFQSNKNLLLSNDARVDTKPQLEILNDDVKCAHGATVGQLEEEELFYLLSRGLNVELAGNLLTYGFAEEIINKIGIDSIRRGLEDAVLNRLHARLDD